MKKMILAALALITINAQAQVVGTVDATPVVGSYEEKLECTDPGTGTVNNRCMEVNRDRDIRRAYGLEHMTPVQKKLLGEMAEQMIKNQSN
jgi:hypothetical protein